MPDNPLVLGLDTSGIKCLVALWRDNQVLYQQTVTAPNLHSTLLAGLVGGGLQELQLEPEAVQLVCVTRDRVFYRVAYRDGLCHGILLCPAEPLIAVTNFELLALAGRIGPAHFCPDRCPPGILLPGYLQAESAGTC
jgi:hypothetical protein